MPQNDMATFSVHPCLVFYAGAEGTKTGMGHFQVKIACHEFLKSKVGFLATVPLLLNQEKSSSKALPLWVSPSETFGNLLLDRSFL